MKPMTNEQIAREAVRRVKTRSRARRFQPEFASLTDVAVLLRVSRRTARRRLVEWAADPEIDLKHLGTGNGKRWRLADVRGAANAAMRRD